MKHTLQRTIGTPQTSCYMLMVDMTPDTQAHVFYLSY